MASAMRLGSSALRTSLRASAFRPTSFNAVRCYSAKTQVCCVELLSFLEDVFAMRSAWALAELRLAFALLCYLVCC